MERKAYPTDVNDDEWALVAPYLTLMTEDAPQRAHSLRTVFNGLCWLVRAGAAGRLMPQALPPWHTVSQPSQRFLKAGVCEAIVPDLRELLYNTAFSRIWVQSSPCKRSALPHVDNYLLSTWPSLRDILPVIRSGAQMREVENYMKGTSLGT